MPITVGCPTCGGVLPVPDEYAGRAVRCGGCGHPVPVPDAGPEPEPEPPPLPVARRAAPPTLKRSEPPRPRRRVPPPVFALTLAGKVWLGVLIAAGVVGLGTVLYAAAGGSRSPASSPSPSTARASDPRPRPAPVDPLPPPPQFDAPQFEPPAAKVPGLAEPFGGPAEPPAVRPNSNALVQRFVGRLTATASSQWGGWPAGKVMDGDPLTSWFAQQGGGGGVVWVELRFPEDVAVRRVTLLGNREPQWPRGYTVTAGTLQLVDAAGAVLATADLTGVGPRRDFEFEPKAGRSLRGVRAVRFTPTQGESVANSALAEIQVE